MTVSLLSNPGGPVHYTRYVWEPHHINYLRLGWMLRAVSYRANGHFCFIMVWRPCECGKEMREPVK